MSNEIQFSHILFLDIETVPAYPAYEELPERFKYLWNKKAEALKKQEGDTAEHNYPRAGIYAEFGRIICISCGFFDKGTFRVKSYFGDDEHLLLSEFATLLNSHFNKDYHQLCAHNGKEFDYPYISRRMLINGIKVPSILNVMGKKPWEVKLLDTMEMWKFGDYKSYTSLELLTAVFDIPTPKDDISGADVWSVYWQQNDLERIKVYCEKDVIAIAQLYLRYQGMPILEDEQIKHL